jgi:hypothetical protein
LPIQNWNQKFLSKPNNIGNHPTKRKRKKAFRWNKVATIPKKERNIWKEQSNNHPKERKRAF